jgi:AcrR family transcriptional regulator
MSRKVALPSEEQVRQALIELTTEAETAGRQPTVLGLARRLGLANATFWRHFPDIAEEVREAARSPRPAGPGPRGSDRYDELLKKNAALRRANTELSEHLALAVANIQRLTLENHQLRTELEAARGVSRLDAVPSRRQPPH